MKDEVDDLMAQGDRAPSRSDLVERLPAAGGIRGERGPKQRLGGGR